MTNTNLIRTARSPLAAVRAAALGPAPLRPELLDGPGGVGPLGSAGPWSAFLRPGRRPALEVYEYDELIDVLVDSPLAGTRSHGARHRRSDRPGEEPVSCAWGRLPPCAAPGSVRFLAGGLRRGSVRADAVRVAGRFWFASVAGEFRRAQVRSECRCAGQRAGWAA
ncbi:hypothetical protein [Kitasatospora sp. NPDC088134]|uniref:hypothetical protein n=1 Tax=Kitasatospora sp. NPDC088134 TaxID=3364071 RepID=UPI003819BD43